MCIGSNNGLLVPSQERSANRETDNKCAGRYHTRSNKIQESETSILEICIFSNKMDSKQLCGFRCRFDEVFSQQSQINLSAAKLIVIDSLAN